MIEDLVQGDHVLSKTSSPAVEQKRTEQSRALAASVGLLATAYRFSFCHGRGMRSGLLPPSAVVRYSRISFY
jgi:hypothetical protein